VRDEYISVQENEQVGGHQKGERGVEKKKNKKGGDFGRGRLEWVPEAPEPGGGEVEWGEGGGVLANGVNRRKPRSDNRLKKVGDDLEEEVSIESDAKKKAQQNTEHTTPPFQVFHSTSVWGGA